MWNMRIESGSIKWGLFPQFLTPKSAVVVHRLGMLLRNPALDGSPAESADQEVVAGELLIEELLMEVLKLILPLR